MTSGLPGRRYGPVSLHQSRATSNAARPRHSMTAPRQDSVAENEASYDPATIERKWQERWNERSANSPELDRAPKPFYQLMMFPYPSAEGLHIGNVFAFTGNDIHGR